MVTRIPNFEVINEGKEVYEYTTASIDRMTSLVSCSSPDSGAVDSVVNMTSHDTMLRDKFQKGINVVSHGGQNPIGSLKLLGLGVVAPRENNYHRKVSEIINSIKSMRNTINKDPTRIIKISTYDEVRQYIIDNPNTISKGAVSFPYGKGKKGDLVKCDVL